MVESHVVGITPAQHADEHQTGGSDPLTDPIITTGHHASHEAGGSDAVNVGYYLTTGTDEFAWDDDTEDTTANAGYTKMREFKLHSTPDEINIKITGNNNLSGKTGYLKIYRNGVAVGTERVITATRVGAHDKVNVDLFTEIISGWLSGDLLQIYGHADGATFNTYVQESGIIGTAPKAIVGEIV